MEAMEKEVLSNVWPYLLLLLLIAVEGELAILGGAGAASAGLLNPHAVFFIAVLGNVLSDMGWYAVGYWGKIDWIIVRFRRFGLTHERIEKLVNAIQRHYARILIIAKITNWMTIPALVATGTAQVPWRRWLPLVLLSNFFIALIMFPLGYYLTDSFLNIQKGIERASVGISLLVVVIGIFIFRKQSNLKNYLKDE